MSLGLLKGPVGKPPREAVHEIGEKLLMYIDNTKQPTILTIQPKKNMVLDHQYQYVEPHAKRKYKLKDIDQEEVLRTIEDQKGTLRNPHNQYRSVKELHVINNVGDSASGQHYNSILRRILYPVHCITGFMTTWGLTNTSAAGTFGVYYEKVDTCPVENHPYRELEEAVFKIMVKGMRERLSKSNRFTMLTYEEAVSRLRAKAAIGMKLSEDCDWTTDPEIKEKVMEEIENIRSGKPSLAMVLTMGKREKKKRRIGKNMGSRLISYYPIVFHICEQMIMGNILDALSVRACNPTAVGHMNPVDYFQLMYEDELEAGRSPHNGVHGVADDIAG